MEQLQQLKAIGLRTFENQFSAPEGGLSVALDVIVDRPDIIETVRAYATSLTTGNFAGGVGCFAITRAGDSFVAATGPVQNAPVAAAGNPLSNYNVSGIDLWLPMATRYWQLALTGSQPGPLPLAADSKLDYFLQNGNPYVCADAGIYKLEAGVSSVRRYGAGMLRPYRVQLTGGAAGNFQLPAYGTVAYRAVLARKDANKNLIVSEPSPRYVYFNNAGSTFNTTAVFYMPTRGVEPGDLIQLYRSEVSVGASGVPGTPSDELQLTLEYVLTTSDVQGAVGSFLNLNDKCPEGARGAFLYTNQNSGQGILQANTRPPLSKCATSFKNVAWYANTNTQKSLTVTFLDVSTWVAGTTFSITNGSTTYTYTHGGVVTNAQLNQVAGLIADAINRPGGSGNVDLLAYTDTTEWSTTPATSTTATVTFQTLGKGSDTNGTWTVTLGGSGPPSALSTSPVTTTAGSNRTLVSDDGPNRLYFSKPGQPEHVPALNFVPVGNQSDPIVAISALRDCLFVFKGQDGVFRITGTTAADLRVESFDQTVLITQPNSIGKGGNKLFLASNKGIVVINESGVESPPASREIEGDVLALCANPSVGVAFVGRADESERKYMFVANGRTMYQYNWELKAWTQRTAPTGTSYIQALTSGPMTAAGVSDRFFLGDNNSNLVRDIIPPAAANAGTYGAVASFAYVVIDGNNPGLKKRFNDVSIVLTGSTVTAINVGFNTDTTTTTETVNVTGLSNPYVVRVQVPRSCSYASQLTLLVSAVNAGEYLKVSGVSITTEGVTTMTTR